MKRQLHTILLAIFFLAFPLSLFAQQPPTWSVYFSPHGGCTESIVKELNNAKSTIFVRAYSFTSAPIAKALLDTHNRKVMVEIILDKSQKTQKYSSATFLFNSGIPVMIDSVHAIAHNKIMAIDGGLLLRDLSILQRQQRRAMQRICS